mmetsp:Transcript_49528/g.96887  ORF Transcript_49528/g.96887 Transcript_49528/m.96887 type:complete len:288 (+) Transcript_49528:483-1346(+)
MSKHASAPIVCAICSVGRGTPRNFSAPSPSSAETTPYSSPSKKDASMSAFGSTSSSLLKAEMLFRSMSCLIGLELTGLGVFFFFTTSMISGSGKAPRPLPTSDRLGSAPSTLLLGRPKSGASSSSSSLSSVTPNVMASSLLNLGTSILISPRSCLFRTAAAATSAAVAGDAVVVEDGNETAGMEFDGGKEIFASSSSSSSSSSSISTFASTFASLASAPAAGASKPAGLLSTGTVVPTGFFLFRFLFRLFPVPPLSPADMLRRTMTRSPDTVGSGDLAVTGRDKRVS